MLSRIKMTEESLMSLVQSQCGNLQNVDAKELGEVIDMIKDLEEAAYYHTITKAMHEQYEEKGEETHYYSERKPRYIEKNDKYPYYPYNNVMYYGESGVARQTPHTTTADRAAQRETDKQRLERSTYEGKSGLSRKMYMETKATSHNQTEKMQELEHYIQELSNDLVEMIDDASAEEKNILKQHLKTISEKIK